MNEYLMTVHYLPHLTTSGEIGNKLQNIIGEKIPMRRMSGSLHPVVDRIKKRTKKRQIRNKKIKKKSKETKLNSVFPERSHDGQPVRYSTNFHIPCCRVRWWKVRTVPHGGFLDPLFNLLFLFQRAKEINPYRISDGGRALVEGRTFSPSDNLNLWIDEKSILKMPDLV